MGRFFFLLATFILLLSESAIAEDSPTACVQTYLSSAGYPVGTIDGKLGKTTVRMASEFAATYQNLLLPELSKSTAAKWCEVLQNDPARAVLASRVIPDANTPPEAIDELGGLNFSSPIVAENYAGVDRLWHVFERSLWPGRVVADTTPARVHSGASSIRMHLLPGDCGWTTHRGASAWNDCQHTNERVDTNADPFGAGEAYYGLSIMIGANLLELPGFSNRWAKSEVSLFQWFQYDSGACFNIQFNTRLKQINIDIRCEKGVYNDVYKKVLLPDSRPDVWHEFVVHANWATDETGFFRVLQNGKLVMAYSGPTIVSKGRDLIVDHPQIYAYGAGDDLHDADAFSAAMQYRTAATVWFDDMVRSRSAADIHARYQFEDTALTDFVSAIPPSDLDPAFLGEPELYAEGEADRLPVGAIGPGAKLPADIVSGMKDAVRARLTNAKAYGLASVSDPEGGPKPTLRFEVRPGDCGKESNGDWDWCAKGFESVWSETAIRMRDGEHYTLAWRIFVEGPRWPYSGGAASLVEIGQPVADDRLMVNPSGLAFQHGNERPEVLVSSGKLYDTWHDFVLDVVWSRGNKGRLSLKMNGTEVYSFDGPTLPEGEAWPGFGIRRSGFNSTAAVVYYQDVVLTELN